jgi:hypothetical protein
MLMICNSDVFLNVVTVGMKMLKPDNVNNVTLPVELVMVKELTELTNVLLVLPTLTVKETYNVTHSIEDVFMKKLSVI